VKQADSTMPILSASHQMAIAPAVDCVNCSPSGPRSWVIPADSTSTLKDASKETIFCSIVLTIRFRSPCVLVRPTGRMELWRGTLEYSRTPLISSSSKKEEIALEEDVPELEVLQTLVTETIQIKNDFGRYGGSSPSQWMTGRRHPVLDSEELPPTGEQDLEALEEHLSRRNRVAGHFHAADAKATLIMAGRARNRVVAQPQPGMLSITTEDQRERSISQFMPDTEVLPE
jgi:hypothetical protein